MPLQIPSVLTDEMQLRRLDAWTREAIDERLRVLEDVQQSLWRAAAELQRVRSALPPAPMPTPTSTAFQQAPSASSAKGKGRAVFDVQEEDEGGEDLISSAAAPNGVLADVETVAAEQQPFFPIG